MRAVLALLLCGVVLAPAAAVSVTASPRAPAYRGIVVVRGAGWPARASVDLLLGPPRSEATRFAHARTGASGRFRTRVRLPAWARPGPWILLACRRACRDKAAAPSLRVIPAPRFTG